MACELDRQLAHFVEENHAAVSRLEESLLGFQRAGEGSFFIAEEFALDQRGHQRAAIDGNKRASGKGTAKMNGARDELFSSTAFAGDEHGRACIFEARDHAQHFLNLRGRAHDAVGGGFRVHALAQEFVFLDQADFLRQSPQKEPQFFQRRKRFGDVVVRTQLHGLDGGFDGAVAGHERDFGARQKFLHLLQKFQARHVRHDHIGKNHVHRLLFEQGQGRLATIGFQTDEPQRFTHGDAELADALLIVDDEQTDAKVVLTQRQLAQSVGHCAFPMVLATTSMNCCTRKGFSTQGAPVSRRVATVSSLAMSPVMKTSLNARSGR